LSKFEVSIFNRTPEMEGSRNYKVRSRDPFMTPFDLILHFFVNVSCTQSVCKMWRQYLHQRPIYGHFTTSLIWLCNAYSGPFWGGFGGFDVVVYCGYPQKAHPRPETRFGV